MALDPSIYQNVGRVNVGASLSSLLDEQRARDAQNEQRQMSLASLAMQQDAMKQQQTQKRNQELNMMLSNRVKSGEPIETVLPWAIEEGKRIGVMPEVTKRHVTNVYAASTPQERSNLAARQANPELANKLQLENMYKTPPKIEPPKTREFQIGSNKITQEWDGSKWVEIGRGPAWNPRVDKAADGTIPRKPMTADQEAKYRQKFGEAYGTTINALQSAENVTTLANELKTHKGLKGITGYSGYAPDIPGGDAAAARQKFETLQGKITKMAKDAAASSGSIGPMAVQEWKILRDQITAIDPTKLSEKQMQDVMDDLIAQAENAAKITEEAYISTFSPDFEMYPQFANPRGAMPASAKKDVGSTHPADIQAILNKHR